MHDIISVYCDASLSGIGGALSVYRSSIWQPVVLYSRQLQPREQCYSATEIQALAVLSTIEHFAYFLVGKKFKVVTDHKALVRLFD